MSIEHYNQAKNITLIGGSINLLLAIFKTIGGFLFQSHALIADGIHSMFDLTIDAMVLLAAKFGFESADEQHPYGHQRIQTAATLLLAFILTFTGLGIAYDGFLKILTPEILQPTWGAFIVAFITLIINEILFHKTYKVADRIESALIHASAWHKRSDTMASIVVLLAIGGSLLGISHLDSLAAIAVGLMIVKMGFTYGKNSITELIDTAADQNLLNDIKQHIQKISGVKKLHQLRSRTMGKDIYIDLHILVAPDITVSEGHFIGAQVHYSLLKAYKNIKDVTVHVDPEDDEIFPTSINLANRSALYKAIIKPISTQVNQEIKFNIHYLNGYITLDLYLNNKVDNYDTIHDLITDNIKQKFKISKINVFYPL